jgi:hypothetical protein
MAALKLRRIPYFIHRCLDRLPPGVEALLWLFIILPLSMSIGHHAGFYLLDLLEYLGLVDEFMAFWAFWGIT